MTTIRSRAYAAAATLALGGALLTMPTAYAADDPGTGAAPADGFYTALEPGAPFEEGEIINVGVSGTEFTFDATCNSFSSTLSWTGGKLTLGSVTGTELGCDADSTEEDSFLTDFFTGTPSYTVTADGFTLSDGTTTLNFVPSTIMYSGFKSKPLTGTTWKLRRIVTATGAPVTRDQIGRGVTLRIAKRQLTFTTGCNNGGASVKVRPHRLRMGEVWLTRVGCIGSAAKIEKRILRTVTDGVRWSISGTKLTLTRKGTKLVYRA